MGGHDDRHSLNDHWRVIGPRQSHFADGVAGTGGPFHRPRRVFGPIRDGALPTCQWRAVADRLPLPARLPRPRSQWKRRCAKLPASTALSCIRRHAMASFLSLIAGLAIGALGGWSLRGRKNPGVPTGEPAAGTEPAESGLVEPKAVESEPAPEPLAEQTPVAAPERPAAEPVSEPFTAAKPSSAPIPAPVSAAPAQPIREPVPAPEPVAAP